MMRSVESAARHPSKIKVCITKAWHGSVYGLSVPCSLADHPGPEAGSKALPGSPVAPLACFKAQMLLGSRAVLLGLCEQSPISQRRNRENV